VNLTYITKHTFYLVIGFFLISTSATGQFSTWMGFGVNKSLGKVFNAELNYEYRLKNTREFDKSNLECKFSQNWYKGIETFVRYRNSMEENKYSGLNSKVYAYNNRVSFGLDVSLLRFFDIKRTKINWVIAQQMDYNQFRRNASILRNRILFKHDIKDFFLSPFISAEHFYSWNRDIVYTDEEVIITAGTSSWRYFVGTDFEINKKQRLTLALGLRDRFLTTKNTIILRLNYKFNF